MALIHISRRLHGTLLALLLLLVAVTAFVSAAAEGEEALAARHERWMAKHGRLYTDAADKLRRQEVFAANVRHIDAVNRAGNRTYMLGLNQFSDLTNEEFAEKHLGYRHQRGRLRLEESTPVAKVNMSKAQFRSTPESVDWRAQGAVTPVKNEGPCGCPWAFVAVAATEGLVKIATGNLISMSDQQVLDCTGSANTCGSGHVNDALNYIAESGGLQLEKNYAYRGQQGACRSSDAMANSAAYVSYYQSVSLNGDERTLQELVSSQPVAVELESDIDFQHYMSGIYTGSSSCGQNVNNAVTVVGYGTDSGGQEYWTVKNQWGTTWGEGGYMRLTRGNGANCGMANYAYYPTLDGASRGGMYHDALQPPPVKIESEEGFLFLNTKSYTQIDTFHGRGRGDFWPSTFLYC